MDPHLQKIKHLLNLAKSPEPGEAANAAAMALKLIVKHSITPEQLQEIEASEKPVYDDNNLLFISLESFEWKRILALTVARKYDSYIIEEENIVSTGERSWKYFIYGEPEDTIIAKQLFNDIYKQIETLISMYCRDKGELYLTSFGEGAADGVRVNIEFEDYLISGIVKSTKEEIKPDAIAPIVKEMTKQPPIEKKNKVGGKEKPLDVMAYFRGEGYGREIHIGKHDNKPFKEHDILDVADLDDLFDSKV